MDGIAARHKLSRSPASVNRRGKALHPGWAVRNCGLDSTLPSLKPTAGREVARSSASTFPAVRPPLVVGAAAVVLAATTALARAGVPPFDGWYYQLAWYPVLVLLDAGIAWREGRYPLLGRPRLAASLLLWSVPTWLLYELLNFRLANWYYVNVTPDVLLRRFGTVTAFATVLPAIYLGHRWMRSVGLGRRLHGPAFRVRAWQLAGLFATGLVFLGLVLWRPTWFFPLVWGAVTLLLEPWNYRHDPSRSLFGDIARGSYGRIARLLAGGVAIGFIWELLNAPAATRWIYTVPGFESGKLFEMPLPGFLGFPVFALDCFVIYQALVTLGVAVPGWRDVPRRDETPEGRSSLGEAARTGRGRADGSGRMALAAMAAVAFSLGVMAGMDRFTVDSLEPSLERVPGLGPGETDALRAAGWGRVSRLAEREPAEVARAVNMEPAAAREVVATARVAALRGIGTENAAALREAGIGTVCELAAADWREASAAVRTMRDDPHAGHPGRLRVWIRAATQACRGEE